MRTLRLILILLLAALFAAILLRWISLERWRRSVETAGVESEGLPERTPTPTPKPPLIGGKLETARLFNGITLNATVEPTPGGAASEERRDPQSYVLELKLRTRVPVPNKTIEELAQVNPALPRILPGLASMITPDSVSPFFDELYQTKLRRLNANLSRLDQLLSRDNFYDCQTVLRLQHPETHRKALLVQSEMDVDSDGSDADRLPDGSGLSPNFQPFTSYRWPKKTTNPNPYLGTLSEKIRTWETEAALKTTRAARKAELQGAIADAKAGIINLKKYSFLIGATDPFIVIPGGFTRSEGAKIGDLAVVIYNDAIYPAIVGDVGPTDKAGEASFRIVKEISPTATPLYSPVNDLRATYVIFPGTAETPFGPPDLDKMHERCVALLKEIGGAGVPVHQWVNIIPTPTPTPSPTATPSPTITPSPTPPASPGPIASPSASPEPTFAFPLPSPSETPSATPSATPTPSASPSVTPKRKRTPGKHAG